MKLPKKAILLFISSVILLATVFYFTAIGAIAESETSAGDINDDGKINTLDGAILSLYFLDKRMLTKEEFIRADINKDGYVDQEDREYLREYFISK